MSDNTSDTASLAAHYPPAQRRFDELFTPDGQPRDHWAVLLRALSDEPADAMRQRVESVARQVHENGVTYNIYADPKGMQRPWELDALPFILPAIEWAQIEAAVRQRATLLNRILGDVYGEQTMMAEGLLPPALIHGHAGFLRPCHGIRQADDVALHMIAVDLARSPDGQWWAVTDRTQAPSGAGYALENRSVISRTFPDLLRELKVQPIAGFFDTLRESLTHWGRQCAAGTGPTGTGAASASTVRGGAGADAPPLIVLLTPGQFNETYYEQTYLARHLGFPLVEGGDLTVRNGLVWLKTLSGPQRVHVILRRVDDDFCDPLELRPDSALGVAGLTEVARRGAVVIANGLGSNLLESGALLGYLPALCRRLLGEALRMPSVATWWCGEPAALEEVIADLENLIIKPAFPQLRMAPVFGQDLDAGQREGLIAEMRAQPWNYVAQETVRVSQAPVWRDAAIPSYQPDPAAAALPPGLDASAVGLRVFACATPNGYVVMPGALTRVATGPDARVIAMQRGGASKDTWVEGAAAPPLPVLPQKPITSVNLIRGDTRLSSRVVEDLFWFGRYAERCDNITRLLRTALEFLLHVTPDTRGGEWPTVQALCAWCGLVGGPEDDNDGLLPASPADKGVPNALDDLLLEHALLDAVIGAEGAGLVSNLKRLYRVASHLRERLSVDNWHTLNRIAHRDLELTRRPTLSAAIAILNDTLTSLMTLSGFALDGMTRDQGWRFMSIGRRLERLQFLCKALEHALAMPPEASLDWLLEITDSIVTYRARYMAQPEWLPALDLLLLDESNPRSLVFQLNGLIKYLPRVSGSEVASSGGAALIARLHAQLLALDPQLQLQPGNYALSQLLRDLNAAGAAVSDQLGQRFFSYTGELNHTSFTL